MKASSKILWIHVGFITIITLAVIVFILWGIDGATYVFPIGMVVIIGLSLIYAAVFKYIHTEIKGKSESGNPYHKFFFAGTGVLTLLLTALGLLGGLFVYIEHGNLFQAVGLVVSIIWIAVFLRYFMWAVYNFNINYGLTDKDWDKIFEAREMAKMGYPVNPEDAKGPDKNPYRSQTFGLPPGTVRGMIAFTLLFGGLSLLIVSFGSEYTANELALVRQQFEFFETAFLMMIAFYFGDKSLRYLQKRWSPPASNSSSEKQQSDAFTNQLEEDDDAFIDEERDFSRMESDEKPTSLANLRKTLSLKAPEEANEPKSMFVQIRDNLFSKVLSDEEIEKALVYLQEETGIKLAMPVVKAIVEVESSGRGHLPDGRPKILFEGHKFWYWLKASGKDPQTFQKDYPHILYEKWTTKHYKGGTGEFTRLEEAKKLDPKAAVYAASWGLFQILGENLEHNIKGRINPKKVAEGNSYFYTDFQDFEQKQAASEYYHFLDFLDFIKTKTARGKRLIEYISEDNHGNYDWATFAYGYNGRGYKENKYDIRLKAAYEKYRSVEVISVKTLTTGLVPIIDAGHGGIKDGKYTTATSTGKRYTFSDGTQIYEGEINRKIGRFLIELLDETGIPYHNLTVDTVEDIPLKERVAQANALCAQYPNCYFLSIHSNAASTVLEGEGNQARGFEVWTSVGQTKSDELASIAAKWYKHDFPEFKFRQDMSDDDEDMEKKDERETFYVLRKTKCPAFLVENLFYDNRLEAQFLLSSEGQRRIARCLFNTVKEIHQKFRV
ncbi:N-acetylmuramidase domain-containing protein [Catalinimonas niigatensis]|uniref:N-acetylmuramidase domain-containing protein n=1 Tax=Catalinimonas niigatensis TaxID=1397264 RepID=UPI002665ACF8|nr:N-acetylmuramidase domain-containing protein [Catalinimonas niigatensis]WPP53523.1 N-acetylmuramidase domain-containing protein [Catalinimonas niigatensis]